LFTLAAIFGPQHGFRSDVQDNMIETPHADDSMRRVPVYSLYSETREPTAAMLAGLDFLVIDLQDIGARIYTYIYTMANCLRAGARHGVPVVVCDRPNPIGGVEDHESDAALGQVVAGCQTGLPATDDHDVVALSRSVAAHHVTPVAVRSPGRTSEATGGLRSPRRT